MRRFRSFFAVQKRLVISEEFSFQKYFDLHVKMTQKSHFTDTIFSVSFSADLKVDAKIVSVGWRVAAIERSAKKYPNITIEIFTKKI